MRAESRCFADPRGCGRRTTRWSTPPFTVPLVIGTSAQAAPACDILRIAKESGERIVEINPCHTPLTASVTDIHLLGSASGILGAAAGLPD